MEDIKIGKYVLYNVEGGNFYLCPEAQNTIYRQKGIICSYSGSSEWCNHFFCQMLDLFSGCSPYNYALGCYEHEKRIPLIIKEEDGKNKMSEWINSQQTRLWWIKMIEAFEFLFESLPNENDDQ